MDIHSGDTINRQCLLVSRVFALALGPKSELLRTPIQVTSPFPGVTGTRSPFALTSLMGTLGVLKSRWLM